ncbi:Equilibrative nucleoside transporter 3 [Halotydeus destructor]|nr:Equilibrative nucleoside transporter 3 [Halotydeus destructor]
MGSSSEAAFIPRDKYNAVYLIFILHGIGTLMPWNMFITAHSYFKDYKLNVITGDPETDASTADYQKYFLSYLGLAAQVPNVVCNALNLFVQSSGGSLTVRITVSIIIEIVIFIITIVLAMLDTKSWVGGFFYTTMFSVVILNMANGVYQNCVYGSAAQLPAKYSNAVVLGSNMSGTLTSIINLISIALAPSPRTAAIYYFLTALLVLLACFDTYFALPLLKFYKHYLPGEDKAKDNEDIPEGAIVPRHRPEFFLVFKQTWHQCLNVFMVFFVTLAIFPAIQANIKSMGDIGFDKKYFSPVTCFLTFNVSAMLGNLIPNWVIYPKPDNLWIPVFARLVFIPFFLLCNFNPESRTWPVIITSDYVYLLGGILLGLTSGYYSSLCMMYAPQCVQDKANAPTAGMMAAFFLICGIFAGINFSFVFSKLVEI